MKTKKILILVFMLKKQDQSAKISEIESNIPSFSGLVTSASLTAVQNKIPDVSSLLKKIQIIMQNYQTLKINILLQPTTINLLKILLLIT